HEFGAKIVIIFSFKKTEGVGESWVIDQLGKVAEMVKGSGITLVIEPLESNYCNSGQSLGRVVRAVNSDVLRVNWDAANVARAGYKAYPDEYGHVKGLVAYVHLKNHITDGKRWAVFDHEEGDVDLKAQLRDLKKDGYDGYLSIETHTRYRKDFLPIIEASRHNHEVLTRWLSEDR
ncbi:MAG: sugar phosphate isomerase/epimerase, partial [Anaerolineae bacterium]|nr:sugar phosphate isomerase/epimerase [Anaerolineae bacterium]